MKLSQLQEEVSNMGWEVISYIALAAAVYIFLKLLHTCFTLPRRMNKHIDIQKMLQDKIADYENHLKEQEEKEKALGVHPSSRIQQPAEPGRSGLNGTHPDNTQTYEEKWKERREFLDMLKNELKRVRDGGDPYNWGNLLDDDEEEKKKPQDEQPSTSQIQDSEEAEDKAASEEDESKEELAEDSFKDEVDKKED